MTTIPRQVPRYALWSAPNSAPPLPPKKGAATSTEVRASVSVGEVGAVVVPTGETTTILPSAAVILPLRGDGSGSGSMDSFTNDCSFKLGEQQQATVTGLGTASTDAKAVQEAVANPSEWLLRNRETGQEVDAKAFVELLVQHVARRTPQQTTQPTTSPFLGPRGGWIPRRQRSNGNLPGNRPRPTLLPGEETLPLAPVGPPSPPVLHLASRTRTVSRSPMHVRGRSSLPAYSSRLRSNSSHARSNSGASSVFANAVDASVFKLGKMSTAQIVPQLHPGGIRAISFSPSGGLLATAGADHRCFVFRVQGLANRNRKDLEEGSPNGGGHMFSRWEATGVAMGRLIDDEPLRILSGHVGEIVALSWAPDDSALLTASADGTVRCWHPLVGDKCACAYEHGGRVTSVEWDPSAAAGGRFLTGCMDAKLRLFAVGDPEPEASVLADNPVTAVSFAPGGATFVVGFAGGNVGFYRTEGVVQLATAECRRHGIRHSASQHARHATSPVRRLSGTSGRGGGSGGGGRGKERSRRRRNTMGGGEEEAVGRRRSGGLEERVTGLCFCPRRKGLAEFAEAWRSARDQNQSSSGDTLGGDASTPPSQTESVEDSVQPRAPAASVEDEIVVVPANGDGSEYDGLPWATALADVLVSTNDSRTRVLVSGSDGSVAVGFKLKGHNTDGILGRHAMARYSDDGEFVISGSTDGSVHVWPAPATEIGTSASRRVVTRGGGREGHERAQVCEKTVPVPVALFAPADVARGIGGELSRVVVTGDDDGSLKVFIG